VVTFNGGGLKTKRRILRWHHCVQLRRNFLEASWKMAAEYDGAYQDIAASPGQIFTADGWFFQPSTYPLTEGNQVWLEVQFRNGGTPLALYKSAIIGTNNRRFPLDAWFNLQATNGYAGDFNTPIPNAY